MEELTAKLISLGALIVLTLMFSVIPYFLVLRGSGSFVSARWRDRAIAILNCFAGGVFLGTLLLHLITEGSEEFEKYKIISGLKTDYPLFNIFIAGGFFLVAFAELLMHCHADHGRTSLAHKRPGEGDLSQKRDTTFEGQYGAVGTHRGNVSTGSGFSVLAQKDNHGDANHKVDGMLQQQFDHQNHESDHVFGDSAPCIPDGTVQRKHEHQSSGATSVRNVYVLDESEVVPIIPSMVAEAPHGLQAFLLLFALSFHTIFDGLAVGLQDSASRVWQIFVAISIHKSIIAFCLGLELFKCHTHRPWRAFVWMCFFSLMSPVGIGLGIGLTSGGINEEARLLSSGILQGMAAGTFLYVTFLEILCAHMGHNCHGKFPHVFSSMLGFVFMAFVKLADFDE